MAATSDASSVTDAKNKTRSMCRSSSSSSKRGPVVHPPFIGEFVTAVRGHADTPFDGETFPSPRLENMYQVPSTE